MRPGCGVLSSPVGGLELLTPDVVTLGIPSGDEYRAVLDDKNVGGVKALPGIILTRATGVCWTKAVSCDPELVEIGTILSSWFPCLSAV